jgi:hypothetical protein
VPSTFACLAQRTSAWTTVGGAERSTEPYQSPCRSQSKARPHSNGRQPRPRSRQPAAAITPAPKPGPLWFLLPHATFGDSCRGSQAPVAFSTASPGVSVNSTPTTGGSTKRSMAVALSPHMACAAIHEPPHQMTISLLAMPSILCNAAANLDTTGRPLTLKSALAGPDRARWGRHRLRNGTPRADGTKTVRFSPKINLLTACPAICLQQSIKLKPDGERISRAQHLRRRPL